MAQLHCRILFHVRKQVEDKLRQLENEDITERAEGLIPKVPPIVVVPKPSKPNEIRICVDMRSFNQAIIREQHVIPTIDDVMSDLKGRKVFSKIDLNQGYHQMLFMSVLVCTTNRDVIADVFNTRNTIDGVTHFLLQDFHSTRETKVQLLVAKQLNIEWRMS